jgi:peptidyl-prolyl cis-trans isomerase SurA
VAKTLNQDLNNVSGQTQNQNFLRKKLLLTSALTSALSCTALTISILVPAQAYAETTSVVATPLDYVVAVVDDSIILASDVDQAMLGAKQQLAARKQTMPPDDVLQADVIRQLILRKIQLGIIARSGANVDEHTLDAAISSIAQQQNITSIDAFEKKLNAIKPNGYAEFRQQILDDLNINRLQQQRISSRIKITDKDVDNFLSSPQSADALKTEYNFNIIQIPIEDNSKPKDVAKATETANVVLSKLREGQSVESLMSQYQLKGGEQGWQKSDELPTPFIEALSSLKQGEFSKPFLTSEGVDILQSAGMRGAAGAMVHQYHVRHILAKTSEVASAADAKLKIDDIYAKLKAGASFTELAKTYSDDPGSAQNGGDLSWVSAGEMVPAFENVMLKTPVGQMSSVFQSPYGWHILEVEETRDKDMTEQYRRDTAKQTLYKRQYPVELDNWLREIRATAYVDMRGSKQ